MPPDDAADALRGYAQFLIQATDSAHIALRTKLQIPVIDTSEVHYVGDSKVCAALVRAVNTAFRKPDFVERVYVLAIGSMYFVQDPNQRAGEWTPAFSLTRDYRYVGLVAL